MTDRDGHRSGARRRLGLITIDQLISSASNILGTIAAARILDPAAFGLYGMAFLVYVTCQGLIRALVAEPLMMRAKESDERAIDAVSAGAILGIGFAVVVGLAAAATAPFERDLALSLLVLAVCTPLMVLQDLGRFVAFAQQRAKDAVLLDVAWLVAGVAAIATVIVADAGTAPWFLVAWAGSGAAAGLLVVARHRSARRRAGIAWIRETWPLAWRRTVSFAATQGGALLASACILAILGARDLGAVRGTLLLLGPTIQFQAASVAAGVVEVSRHEGALDEVRADARRTSALTTGVAALNLLLVVALPDALGELVLGDTWVGTTALLLPAGLHKVFLGLTSGPRATLLGRRAVATMLRLDITATITTLATTTTGAAVGGIRTAMWCQAGGMAVLAALWWAAHRRALHTPAPPAAGEDAGPIPAAELDVLG